MFRIVKMLPLLMLQSLDETEPDFFGVFQKINENLEAIRDRLTPQEPQEPEKPSGGEGDQNSQGTPTETSSENQNQTTEELKTPAATETSEPEIAVENPAEPKRKRYPWAKR